MSESGSPVWRVIALSGCSLIAMGLGAFCLAERHYMFDNFALYTWMIGLGLLALIVSVIGLTTRRDKQGRRKMSAALLLCPLVVCMIVGLWDSNVHGVGPLFFLTSIPIWFLGIGVFFASFKRSSVTTN
jgi:uncharacterized membrane protein YhaH (DUF805 family)